MADIVKTFGLVKIIDTGTVVKIEYGGTVRMIINKATGFNTLGPTDGSMGDCSISAAIAYLNSLHIGTGLSSGSETFNLTGTAAISGFLAMGGGAGTYLKMPSLTTAQRDALTPAAGMVIYNSTTAKLQCYAGGIWNDTF